MRLLLAAFLLFALVAFCLPLSTSADLESRIKKLEDEILLIKQTSQEILHKLEASIFQGIPEKVKATISSVYEKILHHGGKGVSYVNKEYPKWLAAVQSYSSSFLSTTQREGIKHYTTLNKLFNSFLSQHGVPAQYTHYITIGVIGVLLLATILITLSLISALFSLCFRTKKKSKTQYKKDKQAANKHQVETETKGNTQKTTEQKPTKH